jgi:hypothetical protein
VIGEVDPVHACLLRNSIVEIDTRDAEYSGDFELSNFHAFEDRETREVVIPMGRWKGSGGKTISYDPVVYRIEVVS